MRGNIVMTEDQGERRKSSPDYNINRGFELMLRSASRKKEIKPEPKKFELSFGKLFHVFGVEFSFDFSTSFDFKRRRRGQIRN